jgi:hypothetical protein
MIYLDMATVELFINELVERKIKECRVECYHTPGRDPIVGNVMSYMTILTAVSPNVIIRTKDFIGTVVAIKEHMEEMEKMAGERKDAMLKILAKARIKVRSGEWKNE